MSDTVLVERQDATAIITLNRPEAMNALNVDALVGLGEALQAADADPAVRAIVLTASGERAFCVGMDLKAFGRDPEAFSTPQPAFQAFMRDGLRTPVVTAANGTAVGGGLELLLGGDIIVLADHVKVGLPEVKRGLLPGGGGTRLSTRIPVALAMELALTGEYISAARAYEIGLVNRVVPSAELLSTALDIAGKIAANGPLAVATTKALLVHAMFATSQEAWDEIDTKVPAVFGSADASEGARAFVESRPPVWTGR
ncbi:MAG: Enoyl-CoA hydratase/isomerase [Frankiales bacterium]|nr:Enoyl-CoA hydratase/isomerase [Frankiales bacterium]